MCICSSVCDGRRSIASIFTNHSLPYSSLTYLFWSQAVTEPGASSSDLAGRPEGPRDGIAMAGFYVGSWELNSGMRSCALCHKAVFALTFYF